MSDTRKSLTRGGAVLMGGEAVVQACGLLRNFLVARVVSPEDFGIAAALAMGVSLVEMLSDLGAGRFLTRSHGEDGDAWVRVAHGVSCVRGILGAALLAVLSVPLAGLMNMPDATWAFAAVGLVPLVRGFTHNRIWLAQRDLKFKTFVLTQALPQLCTAAAAYPMALAIPDFRALLFLLIANALLSVVLSHVASAEPYRVSFERDKVRTLFAYGMPLLGDGALMFLVLHGERIVVANGFGPTLLGAYSAAYLLAWTPAASLGRVSLSLGVPQLASLREDRTARNHQYALGVGVLTAPAVGLAVLFGLGGAALVQTVFGEEYVIGAAAAAWLGLGQALRLVRMPPIALAIAEGFTLSPMIGNVMRAGAVGVGWLAVQRGADVWVVMAIGAAGELIGLVVCAHLNRARLGMALTPLVAPLIVVGGAFAGAWWMGSELVPHQWAPAAKAGLALGFGGVAGSAVLAVHPRIRAMALGFLKPALSTKPMTAASGARDAS